MNLVKKQNDELVTTSLIVAEGTESQHASVIRLVRDNLADFEEFGGVGFEIQPFETAGGTQKRSVALLNREHAMLLMTYMRNTKIVRDFKKRLIRAFVELERRAKEPAELSPEELMARAIKVADHTIKELEAKTADQALALEAAKPKVEYYDHCVSIESDVMTVKDWGAHFGLTEPQARQKLLAAKMIYRKTQTREWSSRKGDVVDRNEYRAYAAYRNLFDIRAQHNAPRYHNGQVRQTLYVRAGWAITVAKNAGIQVDQSIYDALPGAV